MKELDVEPLSTAEVHALKALHKGEADPYQQKLAAFAILHKISKYGELCYFPGDERASVFMAGRVFVGAQVAKFMGVPFDRLGLKEQRDE